jgi:uncharacterized protein YjeT (DUF2065 family)
MTTLQIIILVLALLALLKALLLLFLPAGSRRTVEWFSELPGGVLRTVGALVIAVGVVLIGCAIAEMRDPVIGAVTIVGTLFVVGGMLYQWPPVIRTLTRPFGEQGRTWMVRACGLVAFAVAVVLFVILFLSRKGAS